MHIAQLLSQLTGSRRLYNTVAPIESAAVQVVATLVLWQERGRQRRALASLDPTLLHDIGRSYHEVARECAKPVWRA